MIDPLAAIVAARFAFDAAALFLWGAGLYLWLLVPSDTGRTVWRRLYLGRITAVVSLLLATTITLPAQTAIIGEGWRTVLDLNLVWSLLWNTNIGTAWLLQALTAAGITIAALRRSDSPAVTAILAAALLASTTLTGHTATYDGWVRVFHQLNAALHLLSAGAWVGALVPLLFLISLLGGAGTAGNARRALIHFSTMGHVAVTLVTVSGIANTLLIVGGLPTDMQSAYQLLLLIKVGLVAAMVVLAIFNRYVLVKRLRRWIGAQKALVASTAAELVLASFVIGLVAWFSTLQPTP
ncbi:MAG: copper homeostasis membrane protein CopD [Pseudomonadota bacterium]